MKTLEQFKTQAEAVYEVLSQLDRHDVYEYFNDQEVEAIYNHLIKLGEDITSFFSIVGSDRYKSYTDENLDSYEDRLTSGEAEVIFRCYNMNDDEFYNLLYLNNKEEEQDG